MGECVLNETSTLGYCKCKPFFAGKTCNVYECHKYCHNKAVCFEEYDEIKKTPYYKVLTIVLFFLENVILIRNMYYFISADVLFIGLVIDVIFLYLQMVVQQGFV